MRSTSNAFPSSPSPSPCRSWPKRPATRCWRNNILDIQPTSLNRGLVNDSRSILVIEAEPLIAMMLVDFIAPHAHKVSDTVATGDVNLARLYQPASLFAVLRHYTLTAAPVCHVGTVFVVVGC